MIFFHIPCYGVFLSLRFHLPKNKKFCLKIKKYQEFYTIFVTKSINIQEI